MFTILVNSVTGQIQGPHDDNPVAPEGWTSREITGDEKAMCDARVEGDMILQIDGVLTMATQEQRLPLLPLRVALRAIFASVTDPAKVAAVWPIKVSLETAYNAGQPLAVIRALLEGSDVGDDSELLTAKTAMLALPQWNQ